MRVRPLVLLLAAVLGSSCFAGQSRSATDQQGEEAGTNPAEVLTLEQCLQRALQSNHQRKISQFAVQLAEAQHRQALSGYWPQINFKAGVMRSDQAINFLFPAQNIGIPAGAIPVPGGAALVTIPANAFGPGFPPASVQLPVSYPGQTVNTPAQSLPVPGQSLKVLDRDLATGSLNMTWLLYDGGWRKGLRDQSTAGVDAMLAEAKRTDLEVAETVRRMYWSAVLARQLQGLGREVLARMEVTLRLTESHYQEAAGKINKTDYLYNKVVVESIRSLNADLEKNELLAQSALANTMGLPWNANVQPATDQLPMSLLNADLDQLVSDTYQFNPDWTRLEAGVRAAEAALKVAKSDYFPKLALTGNLHRWWNGDFNGGFSTPQNRAGWTVGVGLEVPVFNGLLTQNKVREALARIGQLKETRFLLKDGLGLQVKSLVVDLRSIAKTLEASESAMKSAEEDRDLNMLAYESDMADPDKVIQSQLMAALAAAQHLKARYDHLAVSSQLDTVIGRGISEQLQAGNTADHHPAAGQ